MSALPENIFAWTDVTPQAGYPDYVSLNFRDNTYQLTVRGDFGKAITVKLDRETLRQFAIDVNTRLAQESRQANYPDAGEPQTPERA